MGTTTMVMNETEARNRYESGINKVGIQAYRNASGATSISEAAETLEQASEDSLTTSDMADSWAERY